MHTPCHNLLDDRLLSVDFCDGSSSLVSLPEAFAGLSSGLIRAFRNCMSHQAHAWHTFLVQTAAAALHLAGSETAAGAPLPTNPDTWRTLLRSMTPQAYDDAPWCLVADEQRPAFMQPVFAEGHDSAWRDESYEYPDLIDVLVTARNHDVKARRICSGNPEMWIFALVSVQTSGDYSGKRNYGASRQLRGRNAVFVRVGQTISDQFRRDVRVCLRGRAQILSDVQALRPEGGIVLTWTVPVRSNDPFTLDMMDPFYIDCARYIRLDYHCGRLRARTKGTDKTLIAPLKGGVTGDPWAPVNVATGEVLRIYQNGFGYALMQSILFSKEWRKGLMATLQRDDPDQGVVIEMAGIGRGNGKTLGLHRRVIPVPPHVKRELTRYAEEGGGDDAIAEAAAARVKFIGKVETALRTALKALSQGKVHIEMKDKSALTASALRQVDGFTEHMNQNFFPDLWEEVTAGDADAVRHSWEKRIVCSASEVLTNAASSLPLPAGTYYRAIACGTHVFEQMTNQLLHKGSTAKPQAAARRKRNMNSLEAQA